MRPMTVPGEEFVPFRNERREERGLPSSPLWSRSALLDLVRAAPLWERSLSDRSYSLASVIGITWTNLRPSLPSRNATAPSVSAKRVWSLPRPTLSPGCHLVPRWRTMMLPARTDSSAELLHAEALALTVAAVAGRSACLFMCHVELLRFRSLLGRGLSRCSIFCRASVPASPSWPEQPSWRWISRRRPRPRCWEPGFSVGVPTTSPASCCANSPPRPFPSQRAAGFFPAAALARVFSLGLCLGLRRGPSSVPCNRRSRRSSGSYAAGGGPSCGGNCGGGAS